MAFRIITMSADLPKFNGSIRVPMHLPVWVFVQMIGDFIKKDVSGIDLWSKGSYTSLGKTNLCFDQVTIDNEFLCIGTNLRHVTQASSEVNNGVEIDMTEFAKFVYAKMELNKEQIAKLL